MRRALVIGLVAALCACGTALAAAGHLAADPLQDREWWLPQVGADQVASPGQGVPLSIVDTGVDASHPEFAGRPATTFLNAQTVSGQDEWRGTAVASVAAAPANGRGVVGVYPAAALQIWDASPDGTIDPPAAAEGVEAAAERCPGVIDLSFGSTEQDPALAAAVLAAVHRGCLVVAASGNRGDNTRVYPAALPHVVAVAATDESGQRAGFSSGGSWLDVAAPGTNVTVAVPLAHDPSGYEVSAGTTFAAPIVAAAAAWVWTARPHLKASQLVALLRSTARDVGPSGFDTATGFGIVDIPAALSAPAPRLDPDEPNDDVDQVKPGALFAGGEPALTTRRRPSARVGGTLDAAKDPRDLYRIWVPANRVARAVVAAGGDAAARMWGPATVGVHEGLRARRRDLRGPLVRGGTRGSAAYVEVLLTSRSSRADYRLRVRVSRR
ncbi:MAG: hypothetical protein V7644_726 [Actinomycetota bacterium]|jgi:subtilisin family serine protease